MSVRITGGVLANVVSDLTQSTADQEGILLGNVSVHVENVISDSQFDNFTEESTTYEIHAVVPCSKVRCFYDKRGQVDVDKLSNCIGGTSAENMQKVIGWYKLRQNTITKMTLMEKLVTRSFHAALSASQRDVLPLFGLFSADNSNLSSPLTNYVIFQHSTRFKPLPMYVLNLGNTMSQYKSSTHTNHTIPQYQQVLSTHRAEFLHGDQEAETVTKVRSLTEDMTNQLYSLCKSVQASEGELSSLQSDVNCLRQQLCSVLNLSDPAVIDDGKRSAASSRLPVDPDTAADGLQTNLIDFESDNNDDGGRKASTPPEEGTDKGAEGGELDKNVEPHSLTRTETFDDSYEHITKDEVAASQSSPSSAEPFGYVSNVMESLKQESKTKGENNDNRSLSPSRSPVY